MKVKSAGGVLDYLEDYSAEMAATDPADTIVTSTWTADGVTVDSDTNTTTTTTVWLSGGTEYTYALVTNAIVTAAGRTYERSTEFAIRPVICD